MCPSILGSVAVIALFSAQSNLPVPQLAFERVELAQAAEPQAQQQSWIPVSAVTVEVIAAALPLRAELVNVTRLLGERQSASHGDNNYPTTILELIRLVEPNPLRPRGRSWKSITVLEISFDKHTNEMVVAYCVNKCGRNELAHSKRKMVSYHASEARVATRLNERVAELQSAETTTRPR